MPNFVIIENVKSNSINRPVRRRDMKNFDQSNFEIDLQRSILNMLPDLKDLQEAYGFFHKKFLAILNAHAPFRILTRKQQELEQKPWITKGILISIHVKSKLYRLFKNTQRSDVYRKFKTYRDTLNSLIRKSKKQYYKKYFAENQNNVKKTWSAINSILSRKNKLKNSDIFLNDSGKIITDQNSVSNKFNNYFINVGESLSSKIPKPNTKFQDYLKNPNQHSFFIEESTKYEVADIIKTFGDNKASDIYGISAKFVKLGGPTLSHIISILFNKSVNQGIFPDELKNAKVIPIHKDDSIFEVSNYRPISLLPIFSKIFEKLMYARIIGFINKNNILYKNQFGFQKNMSTELAVNALLNNIINALDNKERGLCIFLDFAKAFDTVNHDILLSKLEYYGIRGLALDWFKSYLHNRMQCTEVGDTQSKLDYIKCGVPQGSVLGPLLFLLYINDITDSSKVFKFTLFADDTSLFYSHKNNPNAENIVNTELHKVSEWLAANKLSLNVDKSKLLYFSTFKSCYKLNLTINNETLKESNFTKYLGVLIDNKLLWTEQINAINLKLSKGIGLLAKIRHFVPKTVLRSLYFSFIHPHIEYNLLNWGMAAQTNLNSININMKKAIRIISFKDREEASVPLFKEFNILPLDKCFQLKQAKFIWKLMNGYLPLSIASNFKPHTTSIGVRSQFPFPTPRLDYARNHITFAGLKLWNDIPMKIKTIKFLKSFSKTLKSYFLNNL